MSLAFTPIPQWGETEQGSMAMEEGNDSSTEKELKALKEDTKLERYITSFIGFLIMGVVSWIAYTVTSNRDDVITMKVTVEAMQKDVAELKDDVEKVENNIMRNAQRKIDELLGRSGQPHR